MPYRESGPPPCHVCEDAPSTRACAWCRRPTCARHLGDRDACTRCDEALYRFERSDDGALSGMLGFVAGLVAVSVAPVLWTPLFAVTVAYCAIGFPIWRVVRARRRRARFLAQVRATGALPPPPAADDRAIARARYDRIVAERVQSRTRDGG